MFNHKILSSPKLIWQLLIIIFINTMLSFNFNIYSFGYVANNGMWDLPTTASLLQNGSACMYSFSNTSAACNNLLSSANELSFDFKKPAQISSKSPSLASEAKLPTAPKLGITPIGVIGVTVTIAAILAVCVSSIAIAIDKPKCVAATNALTNLVTVCNNAEGGQIAVLTKAMKQVTAVLEPLSANTCLISQLSGAGNFPDPIAGFTNPAAPVVTQFLSGYSWGDTDQYITDWTDLQNADANYTSKNPTYINGVPYDPSQYNFAMLNIAINLSQATVFPQTPIAPIGTCGEIAYNLPDAQANLMTFLNLHLQNVITNQYLNQNAWAPDQKPLPQSLCLFPATTPSDSSGEACWAAGNCCGTLTNALVVATKNIIPPLPNWGFSTDPTYCTSSRPDYIPADPVNETPAYCGYYGARNLTKSSIYKTKICSNPKDLKTCYYYSDNNLVIQADTTNLLNGLPSPFLVGKNIINFPGLSTPTTTNTTGMPLLTSLKQYLKHISYDTQMYKDKNDPCNNGQFITELANAASACKEEEIWELVNNIAGGLLTNLISFSMMESAVAAVGAPVLVALLNLYMAYEMLAGIISIVYSGENSPLPTGPSTDFLNITIDEVSVQLTEILKDVHQFYHQS